MINAHTGDYPSSYPPSSVPQTWLRDPNGILINNDDKKYNEILSQREQARRITATENRMTKMEGDIEFIKTMLLKLVKEI